MSDIVERLGKKQRDWLVADELLQEARDEIVRLREYHQDALKQLATTRDERDRLRDALPPEGYVLVPVEPTEAMEFAGGEAQSRSIGSFGEPALVYRAMLAAALKGDTQ